MNLPNRPRTTKPHGRQPHHAHTTAFVRNVARAGRCCDTRAAALANRRLARAGGDPLAEERLLKSMPTFAAAAPAVLAQMRPGWRNPKHGRDWLSSMERFAFPGSASCPSPGLPAPTRSRRCAPSGASGRRRRGACASASARSWSGPWR